MTKLQIALIILAIVAVITIPVVTYISSTGAFDKAPEGHEFAATWTSNDDHHWRVCTHSGCNEVTDKSVHVYSEGIVTSPSTEESEGTMSYTCLICGSVKNEPIDKLAHTHTWESEWTNDETNHWHESSCGHDSKDLAPHIYDDGFIVKPATDLENGIIVYTCVYCGYDYEDVLTPATHTHVYSEDWTYDEDSHWHATLCGHPNVKGKAAHTLGDPVVTKQPTEDEEGITSYFCTTCNYEKTEPIAKLPHTHKFDENGYCAKCGTQHATCSYCGDCITQSCTDCENKCHLIETDKIVTFAPNTVLQAPEGPDGIAPNNAGAYIYDTTIKAQHVVLANGAYATVVTLPNGTAAHSGVSFANNKNPVEAGMNGFSCGIPQTSYETKYVRMHFVNNGDSVLTFKYSMIDYYYDKGAIDVTLQPGEYKTVMLPSLFENNVVGLNCQVVFPNGADAGASLSIWGEFTVDYVTSLSVAVSANKLNFGPGETFSSEGLILSPHGSAPGATSDLYTRVFIRNNYTTDLDGYVFTEEDAKAGYKTVTVNFGGITTTYDVVVNEHAHNIVYQAQVDPVACVRDGYAAHYACTVEGCGAKFSDSYGNHTITTLDTISCHTEPSSAVLPGAALCCAKCGVEYGVKSMNNWIHFGITTQTSKIGSNIVNGKLEHAYVNGVPGTKIYIGAGTKGATNESEFYLKMSNNDSGWQTVIPNLGANAPAGEKRKVILFYVNYSDQDVVMNLQNDASGGNGKVTIPANGTAICEFTIKNSGGSNWFHYYVDCDIHTDVVLGVYGYFYVYSEEVDSISINKPATKLTYKVGETFSTEGLIVNVPITMSNSKTCYANTGFYTDFDGRVFTEADVGKHTVTVIFGNVSCIYEIEVEA